MIKKVLTIAGSDSSGGAGIQADLKTFCAHNAYGMSAITAITAQNTRGVYDVQEVDEKVVMRQLDAVFQDIYPDAVKTGMLPNENIVKIVKSKLVQYGAKNVVIDPVMVSTSGYKLIEMEARKQIIEDLFPLATIITPNIPEAELLTGLTIKTEEDVEKAMNILRTMTKGSILIKGGHFEGEEVTDYLMVNNEMVVFTSKRIDTKNTHGTGCTLSSAIASNLANGDEMIIAVQKAKDYVSGAIVHDINLGQGNGPLNHMWNLFK